MEITLEGASSLGLNPYTGGVSASDGSYLNESSLDKQTINKYHYLKSLSSRIQNYYYGNFATLGTLNNGDVLRLQQPMIYILGEASVLPLVVANTDRESVKYLYSMASNYGLYSLENSSGNFLGQNFSLYEIENDGEEAKDSIGSFASTSEYEILGLHPKDKIIGIDAIRIYLSSHSDLIELLGSGIKYIKDTFNPREISLSSYVDVDEGWEKLFLQISINDIDIDQSMLIEDHLVAHLVEPKKESWKGRVIFEVV